MKKLNRIRQILIFTLLTVVITIGANDHDASCDSNNVEVEDMSMKNRTELLELILVSNMDEIDPRLKPTVQELKRRGAHRCWHKHSNFLDHLIGVYNILQLWMLPVAGIERSRLYARVGLLHSAYSNSYVNLALFDPSNSTERSIVSDLIGEEAEEIVFLFCNINRQQIVVDTLLKQGYIPEDGLEVSHLREPSKTIHLSADMLQLLVIFTMADIADQYFGWQDQLFGFDTKGNSMLLPDDNASFHYPKAIWPGISKPGLWVSYVSSLGVVAHSHNNSQNSTLPPVFNNCSATLSLNHEVEARNLYWEVVTNEELDDSLRILKLEQSINLNPWVFEPFILLSQVYLHEGRYNDSRHAASRALRLQEQLGFPWDKRLGFSAWRAWSQVLYQRAQNELPWPNNSWEINNFGLVV